MSIEAVVAIVGDAIKADKNKTAMPLDALKGAMDALSIFDIHVLETIASILRTFWPEGAAALDARLVQLVAKRAAKDQLAGLKALFSGPPTTHVGSAAPIAETPPEDDKPYDPRTPGGGRTP